ncbi:hypothetical protein D9M68_667930 [compost metagenome]
MLGLAQFLCVEHGAAQGTRLLAQQFLRHRLAVDAQVLAAAVGDAVAGQADHALDVVDVRVAGVAEHHDIAALRITHLDHLGVQHRQADAVGELVDQDEIAHFQCGLHRAGRDLEGLDQEGAQHQHDGQHREEGLPVLHQQRFLVQPVEHLRIGLADLPLVGGDRGTPARGQQNQVDEGEHAADCHGDNQQQREIDRHRP